MSTFDAAAAREHLSAHGDLKALRVGERAAGQWLEEFRDAREAQAALEELGAEAAFPVVHGLFAEEWLMVRHPLRRAAVAAAVEVARTHDAGDLVVPLLVGLQTEAIDPDPGEVRDALVAMGPPAVEPLAALVADELGARSQAGGVLRVACEALTALDGRRLREVLDAGLESEDVGALRSAVECHLERFRRGECSPEEVESLGERCLQLLKRYPQEWKLAGELLTLLGALGVHLDRTLPALLSALNPVHLRKQAAGALTELGSAAGELGVRALHHALFRLRGKDLETQRAILAGLTQLGEHARAAASEVVLRLWTDPLRREATRALATLCDLESLTPFIEAASLEWSRPEQDTDEVRHEYQSSLDAVIGRLQEEALPVLGEALRSKRARVRLAAARGLRALDRVPLKQVRELVERAERDHVEAVRVAATESFDLLEAEG